MADQQSLTDFVKTWSLQGRPPVGGSTDSDESFEDILGQIRFMAEHAYSRYIPAMYSKSSPVFQDRMAEWMANVGVTEDDQVALFQLIPRLAYFSFEDFLSLYRTAYSNQISRWVWEQAGLGMEDPDFADKLQTERSQKTWYASITDSFIISEFYHANSISGVKFRPNFLNLSEFASPTKVKAYMQAKGFERLVLLEDFVGGGTQAAEVIPWVVTNLDIPVLFCPMLICPDGMRNLVALAAKTAGKLVVNPVILLGDSAFISSHDKTDPVMNYIEQLILRLHPEIQGSVSGWNPPYSEHGYSQPGDIDSCKSSCMLYHKT